MSNLTGAIIIEGHVQGLSNVRSLGEAGIPVYVVDKRDCIARYSRYCNKFFISPEFNEDKFAEFLIELAQTENIRNWVLIPSNDHAVYTISKHKTMLEKYYKVITPPLDVIDNIYDKSKLLSIAERCGIPIPKTQYFKSPEDKLDVGFIFPAITKGRNGLSFYKVIRKKALLANNEVELRDQLKNISTTFDIARTFTQELIPSDGTNKTISFTAFCINGKVKTCWMGVKMREHPLQFGTATFAESVFIPECLNQAIPLLHELSYEGVCEVEFIRDPLTGQYKLIEINARTWLWVGLAKACGVDYAKMIYDFSNGNIFEFPQKYDIGKCWINPISDTVYASIAIVTWKLNIINYFKSIVGGKLTNSLFVKNDLKPGFRYIFSVFQFLKTR